MAKLTADEFFKIPTSKRPDRKKVLLDALNSGKALEVYVVGNKESLMVFPKAQNTTTIKQIEKLEAGDKTTFNSIKLKGQDGNFYKLTSIKKSKEFGGGGGSRGGSDLTAITESGQCYFASIAFNVKRGPISWDDITAENLKESSKYVDTGSTSLDTIAEQSTTEWIHSYILVANFLFKNYKMKSGKRVYFHRDSAFHKKIFSYKSIVHKNDKQSDTTQAPGSFDNNKWNPGDIWMTTYGLGANDLPDLPTDSWSSLNRKVYEMAGSGSSMNRELLGVSLKKIERTPKADEYNASGDKKHSYSFKGFIVSPERLSKGQIPFFSSIDCYLYIGDGRVQFRATSGISSKPSWQGEISGSTAAGGKIGGGNVNTYLKNNFGEGIFINSESEIVNKINSPSFWNEFYSMYENLFDNPTFKRYNKTTMGSEKVNKDEFKKLALARSRETETFIVSKFMCMKMLSVMFSNVRKLDDFTTDLFLYGASNTDQSSYFIKIYE